MNSVKDIAVIGATGLVGTVLLKILEERRFPFQNLYLLASERSVGETISVAEKNYSVEWIDTFDFSKTQLCFFCVGNEISAKFAPKAAASGNIVIDKSAYFRMDPIIPLIVPEINIELLKNKNAGYIISNPNCSTIPIVMALQALNQAAHLVQLNIATYQSVSGSGRDAIAELTEQTAAVLNHQRVFSHVYSQQIAFNVIPLIDTLEKNGYSREEMKMIDETRKILNHPTLSIHATAVRVPVFYGHSAAIQIKTRDKLSVMDATKLLSEMSGIQVFSDPATYPTPVHDAADSDAVFVGRIRQDLSTENGLCFWLVCDNLRKGAALNAVQIAEYFIG